MSQGSRAPNGGATGKNGPAIPGKRMSSGWPVPPNTTGGGSVDGRESDIVAVVGVRDPGEVGWALCIDAYGHGLYLPWSALHAILHDFPAYTPDTAYVGESFAAFVAALSHR